MYRFKLISAALLAFLVLVVILQNSEPTQTEILFWSLTMPRAVLLLGATLVGFALGVLVMLLFGRRKAG